MDKKTIVAIAALLLCHGVFAQIYDVTFTPRWPWNGLVDISFLIGGLNSGYTYNISFEGYDNVLDSPVVIKTFTWNNALWSSGNTLHAFGSYSTPERFGIVWNAKKDLPDFNSASFQVKVAYEQSSPENYLVIDLSPGPNADYYPYHYSSQPPSSMEALEARTTSLGLRQISAGEYLMGSPEDEVGRHSNEKQHLVYITHNFYIGIFEVTQKQWEQVMGSNPSSHTGSTRPVENVSFDMIRGSGKGTRWPSSHIVDAYSFLGRIQQRTGLTLDLPTEAHWEYACRAGTTTNLNSGRNFQIIERFRYYNDNSRFVYYYDDESRAISENNIAMLSAVARWHDNQEDGNGAYTRHTRVGCYQPNAWGLYDMHGNVFEWCLDLYGSYESEEVADPVGPVIGNSRVCRGASWKTEDMDKFRAAYRWHTPSNTVSPDIGFRIVWYR